MVDLDQSSRVHSSPRTSIKPPVRRNRNLRSHTLRLDLHQQKQRFTSYLPFGWITTVCLVVFLLVYAVTLLVLSPLLYQQAPHSSHIRHGDVLRPLVQNAVDKVKHLPQPLHSGSQVVAGAIKKQIDQLRRKAGISDAELMAKAAEDHMAVKQRKENERLQNAKTEELVSAPVAPGKRSGFMILGMHRSGTSMLAGLMATGMGYSVGGPLIGGAFDNVKGFFERIDVVLQNDNFMNKQHVWWNSNALLYDSERALTMYENKLVDFSHGEEALKFFNNPANVPWLQKDPRQCLTLRTWLKLMSSEPAILFTYRHPLEVAMSLKKREENFSLLHGLRLWIIYNMRAIQNSRGLCIVYTSNEAVLESPLQEINRISQELTSNCGVPKPPDKLNQESVDQFVDSSLQHNKKTNKEEGFPVWADHEGCQVHAYATEAKPGSEAFEREKSNYLQAMKIYCDFKSGKAYQSEYEWPTLKE